VVERSTTTLASGNADDRLARDVIGLLLVEVLRSPRARAAALSLARSLARWLADSPPWLGWRPGDHSADRGGAGR
jgi:hypothetical protein